MARILIAGLINVETTLRVDGFPIHYSPVRYPFWGVDTTISGVGYNVTLALTRLGHETRFLSMIGRDRVAELVLSGLEDDGLPQANVRSDLDETPQSIILYDGEGRRQINVDLKDIQERAYPLDAFEHALDGCNLAVLCNINFARPFLEIARARGIPIATDVHTIDDLDDDYNRDFMAAADVLFMSDERLPAAPEAWARQVLGRYHPRVLVIGLGAQGALLATREGIARLPAVTTRPVVNTIGAGDALFSAFVHGYVQTRNPYLSLRKAIVYASYKIGEKGAAQGLLTAPELEKLYRET